MKLPRKTPVGLSPRRNRSGSIRHSLPLVAGASGIARYRQRCRLWVAASVPAWSVCTHRFFPRHEIRWLSDGRILRRDVSRSRGAAPRSPLTHRPHRGSHGRRIHAAPAARPNAPCCTWASRSTSTATAPAPSGSFPSTSCRASCRAAEWERIERGLKQRIHALNLFIDDIYHEQKILKDGVVPGEIIQLGASASGRSASGCNPPRGDLVPHHRHRSGARHATARSTCSRTTCAARPACRTCWRTAA